MRAPAARRWALVAGSILVLLALVLVYETATMEQNWKFSRRATIRSAGDAAGQATRARMVNAVIPDAVAVLGYDQPLVVIPKDMQELLVREPDMFGDREQETVDQELVYPFVAGRAWVREYDAALTRSQRDELEAMTVVEFPHEVSAVVGEDATRSSDDAEVLLFVGPDGNRIYVVPDAIADDVGLIP